MNKKGISLVVLVITIIVMAVLATVIIISLNNNGIITNATEAVFKQNVNNYKTELALYIADRYVDNYSFSVSSFNATASTNPSITTVIPSMTTEDSAKFEIVNGELTYTGNDADEIEWATELGIYSE